MVTHQRNRKICYALRYSSTLPHHRERYGGNLATGCLCPSTGDTSAGYYRRGRTQLPTVQLTLVGSHLPADIDTLPVKLFEGNQAQTIVTDRVEQGGLQVAIVVNLHNLLALGRSGQTHQAEVHSATLELIERQAITRNVDLLAAYTSQTDEH